jgi:hypothetical protein
MCPIPNSNIIVELTPKVVMGVETIDKREVRLQEKM